MSVEVEVLDKTLKGIREVCSITERFFRLPGPRTKYFEHFFCRSINYAQYYYHYIRKAQLYLSKKNTCLKNLNNITYVLNFVLILILFNSMQISVKFISFKSKILISNYDFDIIISSETFCIIVYRTKRKSSK